MLSRRLFLLSSVGLAAQLMLPGLAKPTRALGIASLSRNEWPPAILPDQVAIIDRGYSLFTDEFGRLAIVDLKRADSPKVVGELSGVGKKVIDFQAAGPRGYALSFQEAQAGDPQYMVVAVSLAPASDPSIMSQIPLEIFSEPTTLAANQEIVCVGGTGSKGENLVAIYSAAIRRGRSTDSAPLATISIEQPVVRMDLQDKHLVVLQAGRGSQVDYFNLYSPRSPQARKALKLEGDFKAMARYKEALVVAGQTAQGPQARSIVLEPAPRVVHSLPLPDLSAIGDAAVNKNRYLLLGERGGDRVVLSIINNKLYQLTLDQSLALPRSADATGRVYQIAFKEHLANVTSGSAGVEVLNFDKTTWRHAFTYSIPRLPAAGVASSGNWAILAGAGLTLYNISKPSKPVMLQTAEPDSSLRAVAAAGSYLLCLSKDALSLRKMEAPRDVIATLAASGQQMVFDALEKQAYVIAKQEKKATVLPVKVYSNKLVGGKTMQLSTDARRASAHGGLLLFGGLNSISLFEMQESGPFLKASRPFDSYAIRDVCLTEQYAVATAVDRHSRGALMMISLDGKLVGTTDLPQDGAALAVSGNKAVIVGQSPDGKDLVSIVDISTPSMPRLVSSLPALSAASAVAINNNLAIVAGRGMEIFSIV